MAVSNQITVNVAKAAHQARSLPATAGELIQGAIGTTDYLVNFPINMFSTVQATATNAWSGARINQSGQYGKTIAAVNHLLALSEARCGIELEILSAVPRGKGLASSSSEIAAALSATAALLQFDLKAKTSCHINAGIEATDCVQAPGVSFVHQLTGEIVTSWNAPAGISVIMVDCGGSVSTDEFDREKFYYVAAKNQDAHAMARQTLVRGMQRNNPNDIALAATISASINQQVLYKEQFPELVRLAREEGALGVNCAHSGTVIGLMYERALHQEDELLANLQQRFGRKNVFAPYRLINGGAHAISK